MNIHHPENWIGYNRAAQDLVALKRFDEAQRTIQAGLEKLPNQVNLLITASDIYRASGDREKSLEHAELLIIHHPENWFGYGRAAQTLIALKRFDEAQRTIKTGLDQLPNQVNLLITASDFYRASGDREKSLEHAELLIIHHPENWIGYNRAAQDLIALKRFEDAEMVVNQYSTPENEEARQFNRHLQRRKMMPDLVKKMGLNPFNKELSFCIAGNCQVAPLRRWLSRNFPYCQINKLTEYHLIKNQSEVDAWIKEAVNSDIVMMIPVVDSYRGFKFGSSHVRTLLSDKTKFISYPSYHLEVFYPFFGYAKTSEGATIRGASICHLGHKHGDYHDFLAMALAAKDKMRQAVFYDKIKQIDRDEFFASSLIIDLGVQSFNEFERRYPAYAQPFRSDIKNGITYTFNHPTQVVLNELYKVLWTNDFELNIDDFLSLNQDILGARKIPIPSFVSKSILSMATIDVPWVRAFDGDKQHIHENILEYIQKVQECVKFYEENHEIIEWNADHKKMKSACDFLDELGV